MGRPKKGDKTARKNKKDDLINTIDGGQPAIPVQEEPQDIFEHKETVEEQAAAQVGTEPAELLKQETEPHDLPKEPEIEVKYNVSENDTREMMDFVGISSIPKFQKSAVWVRAIAKVLKIDTSVSWVVLKRTGAKKHNIEKIFGHCAAIKKVGTPIPIEVIPYTYSDAFPRENAEEMARFIANYTKKPIEELRQKNYGELTDMMLDLQIKMYYEESYYNGKPQ